VVTLMSWEILPYRGQSHIIGHLAFAPYIDKVVFGEILSPL